MKMQVMLMLACWLVSTQSGAAEHEHIDQALVERGAYLVQVSGCNDCHTDGYTLNNGEIPRSEWLKGDTMGWYGPWGTTYGSNLRLFMANLSESEWLVAAKNLRARPPMPWFNLNVMEEGDLRAIYHFVRALGEPGQPAKAALPPGEEPQPPFAKF